MKSSKLLILSGAACLSACVPRAEAPPPPVQAQPAPPPPVPPAPPLPSANWQDIPLTPGDWSYGREADGSTAARFGAAETESLFIIRCEPSRQVRLSVEGRVNGPMTLRTSFGARSLPLTLQAQPIAYSSATLPATDPLLDGIAFSRGRFTVEVPGDRMLVLPAWAEIARVVEDCRS